MGRPFVVYRTDEADAIQAALQAAGLQNEKDWPDSSPRHAATRGLPDPGHPSAAAPHGDEVS